MTDPQALDIPDLTLDVATDWIEQHCVVPDGDDRGLPMELPDEQHAFVARHYEVRPAAQAGDLASAFRFRRSQLVRPHKWGKSPLVAAMVCLEAVGPALFAGFAAGGERYECSNHWCPCGWQYEYEAGEPMGRPWATALIQITATSEDQTDNTYGALRPMIDLGPLAEVIPRTGEELIRLPGGGEIYPVTSKALTRLGQRVTFVPQDETGIWTTANMRRVARTQRRGLAGMGGRAVETTNAWDPSENSIAQLTWESLVDDIQKDFRTPPVALKFTNERDRRRMLEYNYAGSPWSLRNLAGIEAEIAELMAIDPAEAERFFGNRLVAARGTWLPAGLWESAYAGLAA